MAVTRILQMAAAILFTAHKIWCPGWWPSVASSAPHSGQKPGDTFSLQETNNHITKKIDEKNRKLWSCPTIYPRCGYYVVWSQGLEGTGGWSRVLSPLSTPLLQYWKGWRVAPECGGSFAKISLCSLSSYGDISITVWVIIRQKHQLSWKIVV